MWNLLIKPLADLASTAIKGKQQVKQAEADSKAKAMQNKSDWETISAKAAADSWKDELWTILFVAIIGACFVPVTQPYVFEGFRALETTPQWFQIAVGMSISASFGIKAYNLFKK